VTNLAATTDPALRELLARIEADQPKQQSSLVFPGGASSVLGRTDTLSFPPWMEGRWAVTSRPLSIAAPLGRRFLPADLARVRLGDLSELSVPPLQYEVSFVRRATDGAIVSDRINNLRAVQDAAAGFARVETASFDEKASKISVTYSPFGRNGTYPGPSRAEVYINWRRQSAPRPEAAAFAFSEATRTVYLAAQREKSSITDAETICSFTRGGGGGGGEVVMARQRVLRFLTANPNSAEGVMWSEAGGRAVASLEYELRLERLSQARGLS